jgi:hypothetical protein
VVTFEETGNDAGNFNFTTGFLDDLFPGIPGNTGHDEQFVVELTTFLELSAGIHAIGVNVQDGFALFVGNDSRDLFNSQLLASSEGTKPQPSDQTVIFKVDQDGLYSFRLLHFESHDDVIVNFSIATEGAALEFYTVDPDQFAVDADTAEKILVNDSSSPNQ